MPALQAHKSTQRTYNYDHGIYSFSESFLDLVGSFPPDRENNRYVLTLQCELTKFVEGYSLPNKEADTVAKSVVTNFILRYGIQNEIVTDRETEFLAETFKNTCKLLNIKQMNYSIPS